MYSSPASIRWFEWINCQLNITVVKCVKNFVEKKIGNKTFQIVFSYNIVDYHANIDLSTLFSEIQSIQLCGSYLHSKGAYLLNIASAKINCQYNSPQELIADYLSAVLSQNAQLMTIYMESLPSAHVAAVENSLKSVLSMPFMPLSTFNISENLVDYKIAEEIAIILSFLKVIQTFCASNNNLAKNAIIIKALQSITTLKTFNISNNNICEGTANDVALVLSHSASLQKLFLDKNNFKTVGMIIIAKALRNISTLTVFDISNNNIGGGAADDIAAVLVHNNKLQKLYLQNNSFSTAGVIKIAKALQNIFTLTVFNLSNNNIGEEATDDIATVLSQSTNLQELYLDKNNFETAGIIKIVKALQYIVTLTVFNISNNNVGEEAADDIASILPNNDKLQTLDLQNNSFKRAGIIKITRALKNSSSLTWFNISNNSVGEEAGNYIAAILSHGTNPRVLHVDKKTFKKLGLFNITKILQNFSTLIVFNIDIATDFFL